jgi:NTE family protein
VNQSHPYEQDTALARLFVGPTRSPDAAWFSLPGGRTLIEAGEEADSLYYLMAGRLGAVRREAGQEPQFLGLIRPGEPAGEMAMIAGTPHTATVVALRDSEIVAIPRAAFFRAVHDHPEVMSELAHLMILRARGATGSSLSEPAVFGFVGVGERVKVRELVEGIERAVAALGYVVTTVGAEAASAPTEWFSNVEASHDIVLYCAESADEAWKPVIGRQVDRLFRVGNGSARPPRDRQLYASEPLRQQHLVDLILIQDPERASPRGSDAWLGKDTSQRLFQVRRDDPDDLARMARVLVGQSVGLVLSGGGARAYAHIGVIRALRESGVPIDFVGGSSMGAIIAAGLAMGWGDEEMNRRIRKAFVETSPLDDIAFPIIAMTHGFKVHERLREHFGDVQIADLWLPYFAISSDLTAGAYRLHRRGRLRDTLEASIALPGILPPFVLDGHVLVDGAVTKNFPSDIMRAMHMGPIVGVDVTHARGITGDDVAAPKSVWKWLFSGDWRRGPPIVSVLMRAATLSTGRELQSGRDCTDVLITPEVANVEIRNWKAFDPAVEAGYRAAREALDKLRTPVTEIRRRPTLREARADRLRSGGR